MLTLEAHASTSSGKPTGVGSALDDAIVTTSRDNVILSWNSGAERLLGYRAHEVIGKNIAFLFPEKHREIDALNSRDVISGLTVRNSVAKTRCKQGMLASLIYTLVPMRDRAGRVVGILRICKDISAFKTACAALVRAKDQLERPDRVEDGVLRAMSLGVGVSGETDDPVRDESRRMESGFRQIVTQETRRLRELLDEIETYVQRHD